MELTISDDKMKIMITEVLSEMIQQKKEVFYGMFLDALKDVGLANAIIEGRKK